MPMQPVRRRELSAGLRSYCTTTEKEIVATQGRLTPVVTANLNQRCVAISVPVPPVPIVPL
jgi:hypothetical protein